MITLRNIRKIYTPGDQQIRALDGVDLTIAKGEFVAIMGSSGSGKSTLMQILGLLDDPSSGEYELMGQPITQLSAEAQAALRTRHFGFVFQQFFLLPKLSAHENVALPLFYAGQARAADEVANRLDQVGLAERANHRPNEMSGGQQQRVAIARALINNPEIIFADEPTGNLDSKTKVEIMQLLCDLHAQGKTVIMVTHEDDMAAYAQRLIVMKDGRVISDSNPPQTAKPQKTLETRPSVPSHTRRAFFDYIKEAFRSIVGHKTRSFLSVLGILIGVAAVIAMLSLGEGANRALQRQLSSLGSNMLMVHPGRMMMGGVAMQSGSATRLTLEDADALMDEIPYLDAVSAAVSSRVQVIANGNNANTSVSGVQRSYEQIRSMTPIAGRFFSQAEADSGQKVCLLGATVIKALWGESKNPIGETIRINSTYFTVIGVLPVKGTTGPRDQDDVIVMPIKTAMKRLLNKHYIDNIYANVAEAEYSDLSEQLIIKTLKQRHRATASSEPFEVRNMADIKATLSSMTQTMSGLLGSVAAISLIVGGIGIMNIMLVAVVERTKEIGLRKAIGATQSDILSQFLFEAVLLSLLGGFLGIALGAGSSFVMAKLLGWSVFVSPSSIALSAGFSFVIGVVFGLWPARKAAALSPIVALRYE